MTPDTPTTATAAIFEKYPRPWRYTGFDYRDATGKLILTDEIPPAVIVSAVNSAWEDNEKSDAAGYIRLRTERDELRSALAAARDQLTAARLLHDKMQAELEQHGQLQLLLKRVRDHVLPYADNDSTLRMDLNDIDAALSPSQPTPTWDWTGKPCPRCKGHSEIDNEHSHQKCPSCAGTGDEYGVVQPTPDAGEKQPPAHAFEVRISIGGEDWDYVVRTLDELSKHIPEHGPTCGLCSGGAGGSHSVTIHQRDVTPEQYHVELQQWLKAHKASKEAASPLRAAGGGGEGK